MSLYQLNEWRRLYWQTDHRYYIAELKQDLFGEWMVCRYWGSRTSARGNQQHLFASTYEHGLMLMQVTAKRRQARGYESSYHLCEAEIGASRNVQLQ